jgi:hypothetical protein
MKRFLPVLFFIAVLEVSAARHFPPIIVSLDKAPQSG